MEDFSLHHHVIDIAGSFLQPPDILAGETGHDAVNQRGADVVVFDEPVFEPLVVLAEILFPELNVLQDALLEVMAVEENQLTGEEDKSFSGIAVEGLDTTVEQLGELAGIAGCWSVRQLARRVEVNARLGGVGDDEPYVRLFGKGHEGRVLRVGVEHTADDVDAVQRIDGFALLASLQIDVIEAILPIQPVRHAPFNRLDNYNGGVEVRPHVHIPDNPVSKGAKEVPLSKLDDFLRSYALRCSLLV